MQDVWSHVSQLQMGKSLNRVSPAYQNARRTATVQQIIPASYHAEYLGHKIHVNKKKVVHVRSYMHNVAAVRVWIQWHDSGVSHNTS